MPRELLTVSQAARRLNVSEGTVRRLADAGLLPVRLAGRTRLFEPEAVDALAERRRRAEAREPAPARA